MLSLLVKRLLGTPSQVSCEYVWKCSALASMIQFFVCVCARSIQRYAVIPLSTNSGLIGWVPHCDTLHALIRDYREKKKILLNIEHRIMLRVHQTMMLFNSNTV